MKFEVVRQWKGFGFNVEVFYVGVRGASCNDSQCTVLSCLKLFEVWGPDSAGVFNDWENYCFVGGYECFLLHTVVVLHTVC